METDRETQSNIKLAGEISHDLAALLARIGGWADLLLRDLPGEDPLRLPALEIRRSGDLAATLNRRLIATVRHALVPMQDAGLPAGTGNAAAPAVSGGLETILVVEDSETVRGLVCAILGQAGYTVLAASEPDEALAMCERCGQSVDLLVTDVMMPGMSGVELAGRLSNAFPRMKVIYISGFPGETVVEEGLLDDRGAFLQKPFPPDALLSMARKMLDE